MCHCMLSTPLHIAAPMWGTRGNYPLTLVMRLGRISAVGSMRSSVGRYSRSFLMQPLVYPACRKSVRIRTLRGRLSGTTHRGLNAPDATRPRWPLRPLAVRVVKQLVRTISGMLGKLLMLNEVCTLSLLVMIEELALNQATQHFLMGSLTIVIGRSDRTLGTATRFHVLNSAIGNAYRAPYGLHR